MNAPVSIPSRHRAAAILTLLIGLVVGSLQAQQPDAEIAWEVIGTGGGVGITGGQHAVSFTLGQPIVGIISGTGPGLAATFYQGFWLPIPQTSSVKTEAVGNANTASLRAVPNPFSTTTAITYRLQNAGRINLLIFDLLGRPVRRLAAGPTEAGTHSIRWNGTDDAGEEVPAGHYLCRIETDTPAGERSIGTAIIQHL